MMRARGPLERLQTLCDLLVALAALTGAVLAVFDRNWTTVIWASVSAVWVWNARMRGRSAEEWERTAELWMQRYADQTRWGNRL